MLAEGRIIMKLMGRYRVVKPVRFFVCILIMVMGLSTLLFTVFVPSTEAAAADTYRQVVVHENETIWTIAEENCPSGTDPRIHVKEICEINDVDPGEIQPGDVLIVPVEA